MAHDGDTGLGQEVRSVLGDVGRHRAQREGVAHRNAALQAGRLRPLGDAPLENVLGHIEADDDRRVPRLLGPETVAAE